MFEYKQYPKIFRLGKEETDGILENEIVVQEKIDGANISIFQYEGKLRCGTRTKMLNENESFRGFHEAVKNNFSLSMYFSRYPRRILYGEWLVKHTVTYPDEVYRKIYLFDIYDAKTDSWLDQDEVRAEAEFLGLEYPHVFATGNLNEEQIKEFVGKSAIAPAGEGVVIKSNQFINKFGNHCYAKIVTQKFKESNAIIFGGNNKHSETYWEMWVVNKFCTCSRVQKNMQKIQSQIESRLDMEHTSQIAQTCYYDLITEDIWEIAKKVPAINFKSLQRLCYKKFIQIYHDILNNSLSVADLEKEK